MYSITDYSIEIDDSGIFYVIKRSNGAKQASFDLTSSAVEISKVGSDFCFIGSIDPEDGYVNMTGLENNSITMSESAIVQNIGGTDTIDLAVYNAIFVLDKKEAAIKSYKQAA
jgi:hypothetical protein